MPDPDPLGPDLAGLTRDELFELESDYIARADAAHLADERAEEDAWQQRLEVVQRRMDRLDAESYVPSPRIVDRYVRARAGRTPRRGARRRGAGRPAARRAATSTSRDGPDDSGDEPPALAAGGPA